MCGLPACCPANLGPGLRRSIGRAGGNVVAITIDETKCLVFEPFCTLAAVFPTMESAMRSVYIRAGCWIVSSKSLEIADWLDATYEALSRNDIGLFLSSFAEDARWTVQGHSVGLPQAGMHVGRAAIGSMVGAILADFRPRDFFIEDILVGEGTAAVRWSAMLHSAHTERMGQIEVFDHIVFRDRSIRSLTQFFDSGAVATMAGLILPGAPADPMVHFLRQTSNPLKR